MQTKQNIEKTDYLYRLLHLSLYSVFRKFYKKTVVIGKKDLPTGESFFVTPNHQNAMMDAMAILFTIGRPNPVFMARADIFKNKTIAKLLYFIKILPVFRIRDGKDSLQNNSKVFQQTVDIVRKGVPLIIYPEGNHDGHRRFRVVKKGVIRTAFSALEQFEEGKKLYIVPSGIEYNTSYEKAMQNLVVFYGKPILVNDFFDLYKEDKARGERQLQLALYARMSDQMIDIKSEDYYDYYDIVRETAYADVLAKAGKKNNPEQKLYAQQEIILALDAALKTDEASFSSLQDDARDYRALTKKLNLRDWLFNKEHYSTSSILMKLLLGLVMLPIALYGWVFSGLQFIYASHQAEKSKDPQWKSTMRFVMGFTLIPLTHLILALLSRLMFDNNWWSLLVYFTFVYTGYFAKHFQVWGKKLFGQIRYNKLRKSKNVDFLKAEALRKSINTYALDKLFS